jgi:hypothetical protein
MTFVAVNPTMPNNAKFDRDPDFARRVLKLVQGGANKASILIT